MEGSGPRRPHIGELPVPRVQSVSAVSVFADVFQGEGSGADPSRKLDGDGGFRGQTAGTGGTETFQDNALAVQDRMGTTVHRVAIDLHDEVSIWPEPLTWIRHIDRICLEFGSSFTKDARRNPARRINSYCPPPLQRWLSP